MYTIFIEYKLNPQYGGDYIQEIKTIESKLPADSLITYEQLEATDQVNLYVERLEMNTLEYYQAWKEELNKDEPNLPWSSVLSYILGGKNKFNMWAFQRTK